MLVSRKPGLQTALRFAAHIGALLPLFWLAASLVSNSLSANPFQAFEQRTGRDALALLTLSLACTPVSLLFHYRFALKLRRIFGLYAFLYACLHLLAFLLDYGLDWNLIVTGFLDKPFIIAGAAGFIILLALAVTSTAWWKRRLKRAWKKLHSFVYAAGVILVLHEAWALKGDIFLLRGNILQPLLNGGLILALLIVRLPPLRRRLDGIFAPARLNPGNTVYNKNDEQ